MRSALLLLVLVAGTLAVVPAASADDCIVVDPDRAPFVFVNPFDCGPEDVPPLPVPPPLP